jgi:hypothetical protein
MTDTTKPQDEQPAVATLPDPAQIEELQKQAKLAAELAPEVEKLKAALAKAQGALTDKQKNEINHAVKTTATDIMDPVRYEQLRILARDMFNSAQTPSTYENQEAVFSAMQIGMELGMGPREAVLNGYFIGGRYEIYGKAVGALLRRKGWRWKFTNDADEAQELSRCVVTNVETGEEIEDEFTYEEAELSGFTTNFNKYTKEEQDSLGWKPGANRKRKLRYGVLSLILHTYIPDVMGSATGIAEYSEDYVAAAAADAERHADDKKDAAAAKKANIAKTVKNFKPAKLEEVTPRAVATDAPNMAAIAAKTVGRATGDAARDAEDIQ